MRRALIFVSLFATSCLQIGTGTDAGTGNGSGASTGSAPVSSLAADADGGPMGMNCFVDPQTKAALCEQIDKCPGVNVDPGAFPNCGYAMGGGGGRLDLECLCGTSLCPIGVPASCEQAKALLDAQNAITVCGQRDEGRCVELAAPDAGSGSTCDRSCRDECAGAPDCIQLCGC
jgi:hypothetical protein